MDVSLPQEPTDAGRPPRHAYLGPEIDDPRIFLDGALKWVGLALLLTSAAPVTTTLGVGQYLWDLLPDERVRLWPAMLAFPLAGLALFALSRLRLTKAAKGAWALAALGAAAFFAPMSKEVTEGLYNGLPSHYWRNAPLYLLAFMLLAAAARIAYRQGGEADANEARWGLRLLIAGSALLAVFYVWPQRGEVPVVELARSFFADLSGLPGRLKLGLWSNRILSMLPVLALVFCAVILARRRFFGVVKMAAPGPLYAFFIACVPVLCLMAGVRVAMSGAGVGFLLALRNAAILGGVIIVGAAAVHALLAQLFFDGPHERDEASELWRDRLLRALVGAPGDTLVAAPALPPELAAVTTTVEGAARFAAAHPLLRALTRRRARALAQERQLYGDPSEPLVDYVRRRLSGQGPSRTEHRHDEPTHAPGHLVLPRWAVGRQSTIATAIIVVIMIVLRVFLAVPGKAAEPWTPGAETPEGLALFRDALPRYIIALSWARPRKGASPEEKLQGRKRLERARGELTLAAKPFPAMAAPIAAFIDVAESFGYRPKKTTRALSAIDSAARAMGLPFSVEAVVWTQRTGGRRDASKPWRKSAVELKPFVGIKVFRVKRVRTFEAGGAPVAAAWLERLDKLNLGEDHLGRSRPDLSYALVLVDEAKRHAERLLAGKRAPLDLGLLRLGDSVDALEKAALDALGPREGAQGALAVEKLTEATILATERHELEHESDSGQNVPSALFRVMPMFSDRSVRNTAREVRAYLAEMASWAPRAEAPNVAWLTLARLLRMAAGMGASGTAEAFAGRLVAIEMARAAGMPAQLDLDHGAFAKLCVALAEKLTRKEAAIEVLAQGAYAALFGQPPPAFKLVEDRQAPVLVVPSTSTPAARLGGATPANTTLAPAAPARPDGG